MDDVTSFVQTLLQDYYDLGEITKVELIRAGDTNNSFFAFAEKDGTVTKWYVRQYNPAEQEQDIIFEHAFETYFAKNVNGEIQTMLPVENKTGKTWVVAEYNHQKNYYAVFNAIAGREPYSWEHNYLTPAASVSCAEICAKFQAWSYGFEAPEGSGRREPSLEEQFRLWKTDFPKALKEKEEKPEIFRRYTDYLKAVLPFLLETTEFCEEQLELYRKDLKKCICHKDMNPGNLMFDENDRVSAVFDMDWVNMDYRLYDPGWMCYQAFASWDVRSWGVVPVEKIRRFIEVYDRTMRESGSPLGELTKKEKEFFPIMMIISAMKVIADFACYEDHEKDVHRVFINTWRFVDSVRFMRSHLEEIREAVLE